MSRKCTYLIGASWTNYIIKPRIIWEYMRVHQWKDLLKPAVERITENGVSILLRCSNASFSSSTLKLSVSYHVACS